MDERWKDIPGYKGRYQVSDLGRVRSLDHQVRRVSRAGAEGTRLSPGRILRPGAGYSGHVSVSLGKGNSKGVHALVLNAFVGPPSNGQEALHDNHMPGDNRLENLRWGTRGENIAMDYAAGVRHAGVGVPVVHPYTKEVFASISSAVRRTGVSKYFIRRTWEMALPNVVY